MNIISNIIINVELRVRVNDCAQLSVVWRIPRDFGAVEPNKAPGFTNASPLLQHAFYRSAVTGSKPKVYTSHRTRTPLDKNLLALGLEFGLVQRLSVLRVIQRFIS